jgi:hypothetical protein
MNNIPSEPKDLLGDPVAATPAMNAPLPWRVYRMNDTDWFMARTIEEAMTEYVRQCGGPIEETCEGVRELTDEEMDRLQFIFWLEGPEHPPRDHKHSFRVELARRVSRRPKPETFASTEY